MDVPRLIACIDRGNDAFVRVGTKFGFMLVRELDALFGRVMLDSKRISAFLQAAVETGAKSTGGNVTG